MTLEEEQIKALYSSMTVMNSESVDAVAEFADQNPLLPTAMPERSPEGEFDGHYGRFPCPVTRCVRRKLRWSKAPMVGAD